eukprot:CAMPEP_0197702718 /NCGR_PEP_ID=MMETSP1338-20131121/124865_1 /TAXON_ID=43686 ORGANISM="Pelagodinium beii, Strain RCC1491" /NCGR_SAMPLE_ID=MMETSP1338 /ASSEMBLY_ACC=CAM_ASM_000754 /LENGTH=70 /DNA_ID=CAMNT_0043286581 /DNA_START=1 /DNA_END=210 /DNA_ORIENTATION=-
MPAADAGISLAYVGESASLPNLVGLLLMKAAGLSLCSLGPILMILSGIARGAARGRESAKLALMTDAGDG